MRQHTVFQRAHGRNAAIGRRGSWLCLLAALIVLLSACVPSPAEPFVERGIGLAEAGEIESALTQFQLGVEADPAYAWAHYNRALAYTLLGELELGLDDLNTAAELAPYDGQILIARGDTRMELGDLSGAEEDYTHVLELASDAVSQDLTPSAMAHIYTLRAQARQGLGDVPGAVDDLESLLSIDPFDSWAYSLVQTWRPLVDGYEQALGEHKRLVASMGEGEAVIRYDEGMGHLLRTLYLETPGANSPEELAQAESAFSAAIAADPKLAIAYHRRALTRIIAALNAVPAYEVLAIDSYLGESTVTLRDPATGETQTLPSDSYDQMEADSYRRLVEEAAVAQVDLEKALALDADMVEALYDLGILQYYLWGHAPVGPDITARSRLQRAIPLLDEAVDRAPEWDKARFGRGIARLNQADEAWDEPDVESLEVVRGDGMQLISADPTRPHGYFLLVGASIPLIGAGILEITPEEEAELNEAYIQVMALDGRLTFGAAVEDLQNQVRLSAMPFWPQRIREGKLALVNDRIVYQQDDMGFRVTLPEVDMGVSVRDTRLDEGTLCVSFDDGYRRFDLVVLERIPDEGSFEQWVETRVLPVYADMPVEELDPVATPYGDAILLRINESNTVALLSIGDLVYGFALNFVEPHDSALASAHDLLRDFIGGFEVMSE